MQNNLTENWDNCPLCFLSKSVQCISSLICSGPTKCSWLKDRLSVLEKPAELQTEAIHTAGSRAPTAARATQLFNCILDFDSFTNSER